MRPLPAHPEVDALPRWGLPLLLAVLASIYVWGEFPRWHLRHLAETRAAEIWARQHPDSDNTLFNVPSVTDPDSAYFLKLARDLGTPAQPAWRVRHLEFDGPHGGRGVYWAQLHTRYLQVLGLVRRHFTAEPLGAAILRAAPWANPLLLLAGLGTASLLLARRGEPIAAAILASVLLLSPVASQEFGPGGADHHGWHLLAQFGMILGLATALANPAGNPARGWRTPGAAGHFSAFCAGILLWVGASQGVVIFALICIGLVLCLPFAHLRDLTNAGLPAPEFWRWWAWAGAAWGLYFYLLEFAPGHFAMRLEINHPLYLIAWAASGEVLYRWARIWSRSPHGALNELIGVLCLMLILTLGGVLALAPVDWFYLKDAVMRRCMSFTAEGLPTLAWPLPWAVQCLLPPLFLTPLALWRSRRQLSQGQLTALGAASAVFVGLALLTLLQSRWSGQAIAAGAALLAIIALSLPRDRSRIYGLGLVLATYGLLFAVNTLPRIPTPTEREATAGAIALDIIAREQLTRYFIADSELAGGRPAYVLSTPLAHPARTLFQHAPVQLMRSLYWENTLASRQAYELLVQENAAAAHQEFQRLGLTHVIVATHTRDVQTVFYAATGGIRPTSKALVVRLARPVPDPPPWLERVHELETPELQLLEIRVYKVQPAPPQP